MGRNSNRDFVTPGELAPLLRVHPSTVTRWADADAEMAAEQRTPGGHRRYRRATVVSWLGRLGKTAVAVQVAKVGG